MPAASFKRRREPRSGDRRAERRHAFLQNRLRELTGAAQNERAELPVPIASRRYWICLDPFLERQKVSNRYAPLVDPLKQVMPDRARQVRTESSAIECFPKIARMRSLPASFLRAGSFSARKRLYEDFSCSFASALARTPRSAKATNARLIVTCCSLAVRRTSETNAAGIVTLCRTDLAEAAFRRDAIFQE